MSLDLATVCSTEIKHQQPCTSPGECLSIDVSIQCTSPGEY